MISQNESNESIRTAASPDDIGLASEQFDKAFAIFQEFGLRRRIPIEERWREANDIHSIHFAVLRTRCEEIEDFAIGLVAKVRAEELTDESARYQLAEKYPFLAPERLSRTWSQAIYFSMK